MSLEKFIKQELETESAAKNGDTEQYKISHETLDHDQAHHSKVCSGCSCMCDDISYFLKEGDIIRTLNLCEVAMKRLRTVKAEDRLPPIQENHLQEIIIKAGEIINKNSPCLIIGAESMGEAILNSVIKLTKKINGIMLPWAYPHINRFYKTAKNYGWSTALLDEVRDYADMVIMWRCDPLDTHHRHLSRYSLFARGRYTERGHNDRNFAGIAAKKPYYESLCQQYFEMDNEKDVQFILASMNPPQAKPPENRDFPLFTNAIQRSSYIAIFTDPSKMTEPALETMFEWSASVNNIGQKRSVILPLWEAGANIAGFEKACLEEFGAPWGTDLTGNKIIDPENAENLEKIANQIKSIVVFESGPFIGHRQTLPEQLSNIPQIVINPFKQKINTNTGIVVPVALPGIETEDIFFRADGIPLVSSEIEGIKNNGYQKAEDIIEKIISEVKL